MRDILQNEKQLGAGAPPPPAIHRCCRRGGTPAPGNTQMLPEAGRLRSQSMLYLPKVSRFFAISFFIVSTLAVVVNPSSGVFMQ